jgi:hypothetical protein
VSSELGRLVEKKDQQVMKSRGKKEKTQEFLHVSRVEEEASFHFLSAVPATIPMHES